MCGNPFEDIIVITFREHHECLWGGVRVSSDHSPYIVSRVFAREYMEGIRRCAGISGDLLTDFGVFIRYKYTENSRGGSTVSGDRPANIDIFISREECEYIDRSAGIASDCSAYHRVSRREHTEHVCWCAMIAGEFFHLLGDFSHEPYDHGMFEGIWWHMDDATLDYERTHNLYR